MKVSQRKAGIILSYLSQGIYVITGLVYTPIMLRLLGQSEYGLYQLVNSVVSYLGLLSLGFSSSYMRFYSERKAKNNEIEIAKLNGMFLIIFGIISIICMLCGMIMCENITNIFGKGLTNAEYDIVKTLMVLMIINLTLTFPNTVFNCILISQEKFIFQKIIILLQNILNPFLTLPLLIMGYGSIGMVLITTLLTFAVLISNMFYCLKKLNTKFLFKNLKLSLLKEMWIFTFFIFLNQIVDQINWSVDKLLLGRISGTVAVAVYGVGAQINSLYLQLSTSVSSVFVPKVNRIVVETGDDNQLTKLFTKVGRVQFMIMALIFLGFTFFGKKFIYFWAGPGYEESYYIILLLIYPVTVPLIQNLGIEIQRAKNMHKARSIVYFFIAILNIFISIPLIYKIGSIGAAIGTSISLILGNILFMNWYYNFKLNINIRYFWHNIMLIIPSLIIPIIFGCFYNAFINYDNIFKLVLGCVFFGIVYVFSLFKFGLNNDEKKMIHKFLEKKNIGVS